MLVSGLPPENKICNEQLKGQFDVLIGIVGRSRWLSHRTLGDEGAVAYTNRWEEECGDRCRFRVG